MSEFIETKGLSFKTLGYISIIALSTLFYELSLIRILDVLWYPHFAYMVITLALLGFGISGVFTSVSGLVLGEFPGCFTDKKEKKEFYSGIKDYLKPYNIPVIINLPLGHSDSMQTIQLGVEARINTFK